MRSLIFTFILLVSLIGFSFLMDHVAHALSMNSTLLSLSKKDFETKHGFTVTAYCPGACCNGKWAGMTAQGKSMDYYIKRGINIIAVDPKIIPLNSIIIYNNTRFLAVDVGKKIKGHRLDVFFRTHDETIDFGVKRKQSIMVIKQ